MPSTPAVEAIFPKLLNESQKDWASQLMETIAEEAGANWSPESFAERRLLQEKERVARFEEGRQFTKFGELIPELRREIWKHLLPGPRIIPFYPASEAPLYPELDMNSKNIKLPLRYARTAREAPLSNSPMRITQGN